MPTKYLSKHVLVILFLSIGGCAILFGFGVFEFMVDTYKKFSSKCDFNFVVYSPISQEDLRRHDEMLLRDNLKQLKAMHSRIIIQPFSATTTNQDWKWFLDMADIENMKVIAIFLPGVDNTPIWNGDKFNLGRVGSFIDQLAYHPALYGVGVSSDPFNSSTPSSFLDAKQLGILYTQVKDLMPSKYIYVDFGESLNKYSIPDIENTKICDICLIRNHIFTKNNASDYYTAMFLAQKHAREIVASFDTEVMLWSSIQTYGFERDFTASFPDSESLQSMLYTTLAPELQSQYIVRGLVFDSWKPVYISEKDVGIDTLGSSLHIKTVDMLSDMYAEIISNCSI